MFGVALVGVVSMGRAYLTALGGCCACGVVAVAGSGLWKLVVLPKFQLLNVLKNRHEFTPCSC